MGTVSLRHVLEHLLLSEGAIVIFHDTTYYANWDGQREVISNKIALDVIIGEKIRPQYIDLDLALGIPNIGALIVNDDTRKYVNDIFSALMLPWKSLPDFMQLDFYKKQYKKYYEKEQVELYLQAISLNELLFFKERKINYYGTQWEFWELLQARLKGGKPVLLYGFGEIGLHIYNVAKMLECLPIGFLVSDSNYIPKENITELPIYTINDCHVDKEKCVVVIGANNINTRKKMINNLVEHGYTEFF